MNLKLYGGYQGEVDISKLEVAEREICQAVKRAVRLHIRNSPFF